MDDLTPPIEHTPLAAQLSDSLPYVDYPPHANDRWDTVDGFCDEKMTNGRRAAEASMLTHKDLKESHDYSDLICGLLHLAHSEGHNPSDIYRSAIDNFDAEAGEMEGYPVESP